MSNSLLVIYSRCLLLLSSRLSIMLNHISKIALIVVLAFVFMPVTSVQAINGVPHLPQDYSKSAIDWWENHPYNPSTNAGNYIPVGSITNSGPTVNVCNYKSGSSTAGVREALRQIPKSGGTLYFPSNCGPYNMSGSLEWTTNLYKSDFSWVNGGVNVDISDYENLHFVSDQPGTMIKGSFHIHSTAHVGSSCRHDPVKNFYFKNLTFNDPGNKHLAFIFEDTEDILFDKVTFNNAGILSVIKGNNLFFRDSFFNNGPLHFDGTQFAGIVNSQINLDFSNHVGVYSNPYWVDFHQNNDATCDGDRNGKLDIYEERFPKYFVVDGNQFYHKSGKAPVILGAVRNALFQRNNIQGSISDFVKVHSDNRPNPRTGQYYTYMDYKFISNTISNADTLLNLDLGSRLDGGSFTRGGVTIAYTNATSLGTLLRGSPGSNYVKCGNKINGQSVDSPDCSNIDPQGTPNPAPTNNPTSTPAPTNNPTSTPVPLPNLGNLISNITIYSGRDYQWDSLSTNKNMYTDRPYQFTSIPNEYQGLYYLKTANDDKQFSFSSPLITFTANQNLTVYVVYTDVNSRMSSWLSGWSTNNSTISTNLPNNEATRLVASKTFSAGQTVTLNGNGGTSDTTSMYNVLLKPAENICQKADINQDSVVDVLDYSALVRDFNTSATGSRSDINTDGTVSQQDLDILIGQLFNSCTPVFPAPSPSPTPSSTVVPNPTNNPGDLRTFDQLSPSIRSELQVLSPRKTIDISSNPFGTHTTVLKEGHERNNLPSFLSSISDAGYTWIKDYFGSNQVTSSQSPGSYWNSFPDHYYEYFSEAKKLGFNILIRLDFPRIDGRIPTSASDMEYVSRFYKRAAQEFGQYVDDWEIDNEPNLGNRTPWITEAQYENIAKVAAQAIHEGDPGSKVYGPGIAMLQAMADSPRPYIPNLINEGLLNHIDVFSYHPYRQPYKPFRYPELASEFEPWNRWVSYRNQVTALRTMVNNKPLAVTEMGYPTNFNRSTDQRDISLLTQAKYEQRSMMMDFELGVRPVINFIFKRPFQNTTGDGKYELEYHFNIIDPDNSKKPIYYAVQNINAIVDDDLMKTALPVSCTGSNIQDMQILSYVRQQATYDELIIVMWDAVAADDSSHTRGTCSVTIDSAAYEGFAFYDLIYQNPSATQLQFQKVDNNKVIINNVPVLDSPGVLRGIRVK